MKPSGPNVDSDSKIESQSYIYSVGGRPKITETSHEKEVQIVSN